MFLTALLRLVGSFSVGLSLSLFLLLVSVIVYCIILNSLWMAE